MNEVSNEMQQIIIRAIEQANDKQTQELKKYINDELHDIREDIYRERKRVTELEKKYIEINQKYQTLEKSLRKNNVIIFGLDYTQGNLLQYTLNKLNSHLQLNLEPKDIDSIFTIGKQETNKPVKVKFTSLLQKREVLWNCSKLRGTTISISEDLSIEERAEVKQLQNHLKTARSENLKSFIKGTKLHVNGKKYSLKEIEEKGFWDKHIEEEEPAEKLTELESIVEESEGADLENQVESQPQKKFTEQQKRKKRPAVSLSTRKPESYVVHSRSSSRLAEKF